ncbi:MAG: MATE family efflux transporter [Candidatus Hydrogenedentes bacterium]|nr:MATE family efflux transporter [Candidatus Hydrogenedentota bacterium]
MKTFDDELVSGSILRSVWKLAWPGVLLNLLNGVHGIIDHVLVGHFIGYEGNAAIGVAWQIYLVMVVFIASLFQGMNVLVARYAGRQDRQAISRVTYQTFLAGIILVVGIIMPLGLFTAPYLLTLLNQSPGVQVHALPYLRVLFAFGAPLFLMILLTYALQAAGDPKTPLKLGVLATFLNAIISTVLITGFGPAPKLGATGAALGTCLAPLVSVVIAITLIFKRKLLIDRPERLTLLPDLSVIRVVARIGIPTGLQAVLLNLGGVLLIRIIGMLEHSAAAQAAYTICYSQLFSIITWASFGLRASAATIIGQNIGAGKPERGKAGVHVAATVGAAWAVVLGLLFWSCPQALLSIFGASQEPVLGFGVTLLRYLAFSGVFLAVSLAITGGLQGAGDTMTPMYIALITQIGVLLGICQVFAWLNLLSAQVVWCAILISHVTRCLLTYRAFQQGKWARINVELVAARQD